MYDIDFAKIHRYLVAQRTDPVTGLPMATGEPPEVPILNKENRRSGIHICRETIFTSGSLAFICYARNVFDDQSDKVKGVKLCLKITAGIKKARGEYGSTRNLGETISFECKMDDVVGIWRVLRGRQAEYSIYLPLPGEAPKGLMFKHQRSSSDPFYALAEQADVRIGVTFQEGSSLAFQSVVVALCRIHYPHLDCAGVIKLLDGGMDRETVSQKATSERVSHDDDKTTSESAAGPVLRREGEEDLKPGLRKAIYAICLQSWPKARKDVAQYIQRHAGQRTAQRMTDEANGGDFSSFDAVAEYLDRT